MRKILFFLFFLAAINTLQAQGIRFVAPKTWKEALALAKKENKLIFLDAYTTWCGPCKYMQKEIFPLASVGKFYNTRFINIKMDMEVGEGPELARSFALAAVPTLLFINGDGQIVHRYEGALRGRELIALGKEALGGQNSQKNKTADVDIDKLAL